MIIMNGGVDGVVGQGTGSTYSGDCHNLQSDRTSPKITPRSF